jgi:REP element-mobilizing transposase RayT
MTMTIKNPEWVRQKLGACMPQSLVQVYLHIVFSTKQRRPYLNDRNLREKIHGYMAGICKNLNCPALKIGGSEDHTHLLTRHSKILTISDFLRELKRSSSIWIKTQNEELSSFQWQNGYGAFSVSPSHVQQVKTYIANQETHHRKESFQDEFRRLCKKYGVEIDERYIWD